MPQDVRQGLSDDIALTSGRRRAFEAYTEGAFRHFLAIERKRAERAGRSLVLLLVDLNVDGAIGSPVAEGLFGALAGCLREIDFIGWYRTDRVVGAVLAQGQDAPTPEVIRHIGERVADVLGVTLPPELADRVQVRVLQSRSPAES